MTEKIEALTTEKLKLYNKLLAIASIVVSIGLTALVIALKFDVFKADTSAGLRFSGIGIILLTIVLILGLKKVNGFIKKLEYSDFRQFLLFLISLIPLIVVLIITELLKFHFEQTISCLEWLIALYAIDKIILYIKSFFEYELEIVKKAKEQNKIQNRQTML